ncbi:flavin-containing monooxygenase [Sphaerisporangium aureirubrum]|uniref:Flavin-containing monooxygenase n=1 Tax=Sphaerisporangium aureirubrum TaxID=1544736 RepID=A0ABW1NIT4_9ACTN
MRIAVIGAGPAGLTGAKQAMEYGHDVVVYEKHDDVGGIWNPASLGAYEGVRTQTSRDCLPFSDFPFPAAGPGEDEFPSVAGMHAYLRAYAERFGVLPAIRSGHEVVRVHRPGDRWRVTARHRGRDVTEAFDAVMVANGELWRPKGLPGAPAEPRGFHLMTAKDYRRPRDLRGRRVLVAGGGVSGADIAAELAGEAASVDWAVRGRALFLPRVCGDVPNDLLFSYIGRVALEEMPFGEYLAFLAGLMPDYMRMYRATGLLPEDGFHGAVHVNDRIVPAVHRGEVRPRAALSRLGEGGVAVFEDGGTGRYDTVITCLGYEPPDYGFVDGLRQEDLYEHFFHRGDTTLMVINTPVATDAFGTACPYFEAVAGWALAVLSGKAELPGPLSRAAWCEKHLPARRRYYDCWLESIRIGLAGGTLPDPATHFGDYWRLVSSAVVPANLSPSGAPEARPAPCDALFDLTALKHRVLAALPLSTRDALLAAGRIGPDDHLGSLGVPPRRRIEPWLPYRQLTGAG